MAAYLWAKYNSKDAASLRSLMIDQLAYVREQDGGDCKIIWNGEKKTGDCTIMKRDGDDDVCEIPAGQQPGTGTGGDGGRSIRFEPGSPGPVCQATSHCGRLCDTPRFCLAPCVLCAGGGKSGPDFWDLNHSPPVPSSSAKPTDSPGSSAKPTDSPGSFTHPTDQPTVPFETPVPGIVTVTAPAPAPAPSTTGDTTPPLPAFDYCVAGIRASVSVSDGGVPAYGEYAIFVTGSPERNTWTVRCWGALGYPDYHCAPKYKLDWKGNIGTPYNDAVGHVAGGKNISFKLNYMGATIKKNNKPLDWLGLFYFIFGPLLENGISIAIPRDVSGVEATQGTTSQLMVGTNCPDFPFDLKTMKKDTSK
jgi:hypothetical protein